MVIKKYLEANKSYWLLKIIYDDSSFSIEQVWSKQKYVLTNTHFKIENESGVWRDEMMKKNIIVGELYIIKDLNGYRVDKYYFNTEQEAIETLVQHKCFGSIISTKKRIAEELRNKFMENAKETSKLLMAKKNLRKLK